MRSLRTTAVLLTTFLMLSFALPVALAGTQNITTTADNNLVDGLCSLREAITRANLGSASADCPNITASPNTLRLAAGTTYTLGSSLTSITTNTLTIEPISGTATVEAATTPNTATYRVFAFNSTGTFTLNNLTIRNGDTTSPDTTGGCVTLLTNGTLITNGVTFTDCTAGGSGGGAIAATSGGSLQITGGAFTGNESAGGTTGGGAIYLNGGTNAGSLTISSTSFTSNTMTSTANGQAGGAISCILCSVTITGATFTTNTASSTGGATGGGAIYLNTDLMVSITGSTFISNSATSTSGTTGGAISVSTQGGRIVDLIISGSVFTGNSVTGGTANGGAIYLGNGTLALSTSRLVSNSAGTDGGAIYHASPLNSTVQGSCITNNGDTAVFDSGGTGFLDASGGGVPANRNWWGTHWGPRIGSLAGTGSEVSNGDSINGNGDTILGSILVDVNLANASTSSFAPTGDWLTTAPTVAGATCQTCTGVSSIAHARSCS